MVAAKGGCQRRPSCRRHPLSRPEVTHIYLVSAFQSCASVSGRGGESKGSILQHYRRVGKGQKNSRRAARAFCAGRGGFYSSFISSAEFASGFFLRSNVEYMCDIPSLSRASSLDIFERLKSLSFFPTNVINNRSQFGRRFLWSLSVVSNCRDLGFRKLNSQNRRISRIE